MKCGKCGAELLQRHDYVLADEGFVAVTPFYRCDVCGEEYYDLKELKARHNGQNNQHT